MRRCTAIAVLILLVVLAASAAYGTNSLGKRITLYSWLTSFNGQMSVFDSTETIDASFGDISDHMNFPIALDTEYWPARWGMYLDFNYIGLEEESITDELTQVTVVKSVDLVFIDFGLGYQFGPYQLGSGPEYPSLGADILGGGRYVWVQNILDYQQVDKLQESSNFVDPVIGGRLRLLASRTWLLTLRGDIGGGAGADFMWNLVAAASWEFAEHWVLTFGYRGMDIDYKPDDSSDEVALDMRVHGPIFGFSVVW